MIKYKKEGAKQTENPTAVKQGRKLNKIKMELTGKIEVISLNVGNEKFEKSELVITTDEKYPQSILIEFGGDKSDLIDPYKVGDVVEVSVNIGGRKWTNPEGIDKYFNSIKGWKIKKTSEEQPQVQQQAQEEDNSLPF